MKNTIQIVRTMMTLPLALTLAACKAEVQSGAAAEANQGTLINSESAAHLQGEIKIGLLAEPLLTVNGRSEITVNVGDRLDFQFKAADGASSAEGSISVDFPERCGFSAIGQLLASSFFKLEGETSLRAEPCQEGRTYKITYRTTLESEAGLAASEKSVLVHVRGRAESTIEFEAPKLTVNGSAEAFVRAGDSIKYEFSAGSGKLIDVKMSSDSSDSCGLDSSTESWLKVNSSFSSGVKSEAVASCRAGHSYKLTCVVDTEGGRQELNVVVHVKAEAESSTEGKTLIGKSK